MPRSPVSAIAERQEAKFREINARLLTRLKDLDSNLYEVGVDLRALSRGRLWLSGGYPTFNAYVEGALDLKPTYARALKRVSRFPKAAVERFGWSKLELVGRLWELTPGEEDFAQVETYRFRVPTEGGVSLRTLDTMSKRDLLGALDLASDDVEAPRVPPVVRRFVSTLEQAMQEVPGVRVRSSGTALAPRLTILGLPFSEVTRLRDALNAALRETPVRPAAGLTRTEPGRRIGARRPVVMRPMR